MKKLIIAGGSGFLGKELIDHLNNQFDKIIILSRTVGKDEGKINYRKWDARTSGNWSEDFEEADVIINLCGKSVDCRYTKKNKAEIFSSRLDSTKIIGEAILKCKNPPKLWINGASATIYTHSEDTPMTESTGKIGSGFSVEVCKAWEKTFNEFNLPHTRKINLRISMVFGNTGGVFPVLVGLTKKGLGGTMGKGTQQVSWIHIDDFCESVKWIIENKNKSGVYNLVAPEPVVNKKLMALLRQLTSIKIGLPATSWMLEVGAFFLRTETELILKSRYSYPEKLLNEGFKFKYNKIEEALMSLIKPH